MSESLTLLHHDEVGFQNLHDGVPIRTCKRRRMTREVKTLSELDVSMGVVRIHLQRLHKAEKPAQVFPGPLERFKKKKKKNPRGKNLDVVRGPSPMYNVCALITVLTGVFIRLRSKNTPSTYFQPHIPTW